MPHLRSLCALQVFSFKLRGAYNKMASLTAEQLARGVICSSAGNHAQGVALAASHLVRPCGHLANMPHGIYMVTLGNVAMAGCWRACRPPGRAGQDWTGAWLSCESRPTLARYYPAYLFYSRAG